MKRTRLSRSVFAAVFVVGGSVQGEDEKPPKPLGQMKKVEVNKEAYEWYVVPGAGSAAKKPAIVMIHEWWGLNDWIKQNADRFANLGYTVVAVDLYRGKVATDRDLAHELSRGLPEDQALADMRAAVKWLSDQPDVDSTRIGCIGWCMGGGYSLKLALDSPRVSACVICYGSPVTDAEAFKSMNAALLGIFGADDRGISTEIVKKMEEAMKQAKIKGEIHLFPAVGHAFMNPNNERGYNADAANEAWQKIDEFFSQTLRPMP